MQNKDAAMACNTHNKSICLVTIKVRLNKERRKQNRLGWKIEGREQKWANKQ